MTAPRFPKPPDRPDLEDNYFYVLWCSLYKRFEQEAARKGVTMDEYVEWLYAQPPEK